MSKRKKEKERKKKEIKKERVNKEEERLLYLVFSERPEL